MSFGLLKNAWPEGVELVLADVGSAGGLHKRWQPLRPVISAMLFEPREGGVKERRGRDVVYPLALGTEAGQATLNITALANMSSTLLPNRALLESYHKKSGHTVVESTLQMPVDTLDAVAAADGRSVDAIKVDTQGSELSILQGAAGCLYSSVLIAEIEVSFFQRYEGQATIRDIMAFMGDHGFELLDLYRLKRYRRKNSAGIFNPSLGGGQRAGRLAYCDAIFVLEEQRLLDRINALPRDRGEAMLAKAMAGMLVYGKPDMAAHLFDSAGDVIEERRRTHWARYYERMGRGPFASGILHHVADFVARHV